MKFGFIIHSQSGNTLSVAKKLIDQLKYNGHEVYLTHIKSKDVNTSMQHPEALITVSEESFSEVDVLIVGGWVQAFSLCRGLGYYCQHQLNVKAKDTHIFVTHHFPFEWLGGTHAIKQLSSILITQKHSIRSSKVFNWSRKNNDEQVQDWVESLLKQYK
jgi:NAD(P)H dehydrogenase (quinone)